MADLLLFPARSIALQIGNLSIRWYGLLYVAAFWIAWWWLPRLQTYRRLTLTHDQWTVIVAAAATGVILGGRLGYILFYEPLFYFQHPAEIFAIWGGGMSFHGGLIGAALAIWWATRLLKTSFLSVVDVAVLPVALGLSLGHLGNWLNQELYLGNLALLVALIHLTLAGLLLWILRRQMNIGLPTALFLLLYALQRLVIEEFRVLEWPTIAGLTRGQLLTIPVLVGGLWLLYITRRNRVQY